MKGTRQWGELRAEITAMQEFQCWYCGGSVHTDKDGPIESRATIDHQTPRSFTEDERSNLVVACHSCNCRKGRRTVEEYRAYLDGLSPHAQLAKAIDDFSDLSSIPDSGRSFRAWLRTRVTVTSFHGEKIWS